MDALSAALSGVHMTGAIFYDVVCGAPWGFAVPDVGDAAPRLAPGTDRLVNFHVVVEGQAQVRFDDGETHVVGQGQIVVLPRSDAHTVSHGSPSTIADSHVPIDEALSGRPSRICMGGEGESTRIICGFLGCSKLADQLFLAGLPRVLIVDLREEEGGTWIEHSVRHLVEEARAQRPGAAAVLSRMSEVLFAETLRRYLRQLPGDDVGWLAGARDPIVGAALGLLHAAPERAWTIADLATETSTSRSVLGERFTHLLGEAPLTYLTRWRIHLAARQLETTLRPVLEIALEVGYQSESAFSRAFKRLLGVPPARYRKRAAEATDATP